MIALLQDINEKTSVFFRIALSKRSPPMLPSRSPSDVVKLIALAATAASLTFDAFALVTFSIWLTIFRTTGKLVLGLPNPD
ncbi:hypothetical protein H6F43_03910 [Leptolyngbya sp. FACHB-36]|uniref:hypothetical protein n=1 Tax=Leptolyngbya sp. FACHB-36 TaxID=2692808 RepID=UPI0016801A9D|nr:hypothetical protein [Leptolyngbya sp. FACHB-36]MBD2019328.1 hypothetical protein [Leptolyngbya sp. FACHB-36]